MWPELTADDIVANLRLVRSNYRGTLMLLEGGSDCKLFDRLVDPANCRTLPTYGKQLLFDTLERCHDLGMSGVLGVFDADFDHAMGITNVPPEGIRLEVHDVEMMIVESSALDYVARELASAPKLARYLADTKSGNLRAALYGAAHFAGRLRYLNARDRLGLNFDELQLGEYADVQTLQLDVNRLVQSILRATANPDLSVEDIIRDAEGLDVAGVDSAQLLCGHDVLEIFARALRRVIGSKNAAIANSRHLEAVFRMSYSREDFETTRLHSNLVQWQAEHAPYRIFSPVLG